MGLEHGRTFSREAAAAPLARRFVRGAVSAEVSDPDAIDRLVQAAGEAINNVIAHAAGPFFAVRVRVHVPDPVHLPDPVCVVGVIDSGRGFAVPSRIAMPGPLEEGRRGLALMQALVDRVDVASSAVGTVVTLTQRLAAARDGNRRLALAGSAGPR
jgi:anti-sigma regulatory factor (Ser/Thr protein kinase)